MTVDSAVAKLLNWAVSQLGFTEGSNNWNRYADNSGLQQMYGWYPQNQPWCDIFVDTGFIECFGLENACKLTYQPIGNGSAACRYSADFYRRNGAFVQTPEPGDQIFFYVGGEINHTGIVESVFSTTIQTIEGNTSDMVARRTYALGAPNIAGYGRPNWSVLTEESSSDSDENQVPNDEQLPGTTVVLPTLRNGMGGNAVAAMQGILHYKKYSLGPYGIDGDFGVATMSAVRNFQIRNDLTPDGIVGEETWKKLLK